MSLFTDEDEKEVVEQVAQNADGSETMEELVERAIDESDGKMIRETARRLLRNRLPDNETN